MVEPVGCVLEKPGPHACCLRVNVGLPSPWVKVGSMELIERLGLKLLRSHA